MLFSFCVNDQNTKLFHKFDFFSSFFFWTTLESQLLFLSMNMNLKNSGELKRKHKHVYKVWDVHQPKI